jgi:radical SAM superfamily enzyme YgiQ (UPF0313 family)
MAILSSILKKKGHNVWCIDATAPYGHVSNEKIVQTCLEISPDLICVTSTTERIKSAYHLLYLLRNQDLSCPIIAGGPHATIRSNEMVAHGFSAAVIGPAESRICRIVDAILSNSMSRLKEISGISYKDHNGNIIQQPFVANEATIDIDNLLPIDFTCFSLSDYSHSEKDQYRFGIMLAGRGCPGRCTYCDRSVFGSALKTASPAKIVEDMLHRRKTYHTNRFYFVDDTFLFSKKMVEAVCTQIRSENKLRNISWGCNARANLTDTSFLNMMRSAGCDNITLGLENGNPETIERIKKGISLDTMLRSVKAIQETGIRVNINLMNGFPWDTEHTIQKNHDFINLLIRMGVNNISVGYTVFHYPETELYHETVSKGYDVYNWWLRDDLLKKNTITSFQSNKDNVPFFNKIVHPPMYIEDDADFFHIYRNKRIRKAATDLLIRVNNYNQDNASSRYLRHRTIRTLIRFTGLLLYHISPKLERSFWKLLGQ